MRYGRRKKRPRLMWWKAGVSRGRRGREEWEERGNAHCDDNVEGGGDGSVGVVVEPERHL